MYIMCGCTFINSVYLVDVPHACVIGKSACNSCGGRASPEAWREPRVYLVNEFTIRMCTLILYLMLVPCVYLVCFIMYVHYVWMYLY